MDAGPHPKRSAALKGPVMREHGRQTLRRLQRRLEQLYQLEPTPDVTRFIRVAEGDSGREMLLVRQRDEHLELALVVPEQAVTEERLSGDGLLQVVEGISHFVYIAERARTGLPATRLELELQAEVDKFVLFAANIRPLDHRKVRRLHGTLYEQIRYLHAADTEAGARYRLANDLAARFVSRLIDRHRSALALQALRRFYRAGQADKIHLARAA